MVNLRNLDAPYKVLDSYTNRCMLTSKSNQTGREAIGSYHTTLGAPIGSLFFTA